MRGENLFERVREGLRDGWAVRVVNVVRIRCTERIGCGASVSLTLLGIGQFH